MRVAIEVLEPGDIIESWMGSELIIRGLERDGEAVWLTYEYVSAPGVRRQEARVGQRAEVLRFHETERPA